VVSTSLKDISQRRSSFQVGWNIKHILNNQRVLIEITPIHGFSKTNNPRFRFGPRLGWQNHKTNANICGYRITNPLDLTFCYTSYTWPWPHGLRYPQMHHPTPLVLYPFFCLNHHVSPLLLLKTASSWCQARPVIWETFFLSRDESKGPWGAVELWPKNVGPPI